MRGKATDKEKALIIFGFLKASEGFDKNDEVEKMENQILDELEKIRSESVTKEELFQIQANLEENIGKFKDILRTKYLNHIINIDFIEKI